MINFSSYNIKIDSAFPISWKKGTAYASSRKYDAISFRLNGNAIYRHGDREYLAKKNDLLAELVVKMRSEPAFFDAVASLAELTPEQFDIVKGVIEALPRG